MNTDASFLFNVIVPIIVSVIYFIMAKYIRHIAPMRLLITGPNVYKYKFWAFIFFGIFLLGRPIQILLGPHPIPFIVSSIREFIMIALVAPFLFIGMIYHLYYNEDIHKKTLRIIFVISFLLGIGFVGLNYFLINGSREFMLGRFFGVYITGYDGGWFLSSNIHSKFVPLLFAIRLLDPVFLLIVGSFISFFRAKNFPKDSMYANLPRKYILEGLALFLFGGSLLLTGVVVVVWGMQSQWYYVGAIMAGVVEILSLRMPIRRVEVKNDVR